MPGLIVPSDQAGAPGVWLLSLLSDPVDASMGFRLVDRDGRVLMRRSLAPQEPRVGADCPALAETVALMVERYLQEVEFRQPTLAEKPAVVAGRTSVPASAPASPFLWWNALVGASLRPGNPGLGQYDLHVGFGRVLGAGRAFSLAATVGMAAAAPYVFADGTARLRRAPVEILLARRGVAGSLEWHLGLAAGLEFVTAEISRAGSDDSAFRYGPFVAGAAGLRYWAGRRLFAGMLVEGGSAIVRYDFVAPGSDIAFGTGRAYLRMAGQVGTAF